MTARRTAVTRDTLKSLSWPNHTHVTGRTLPTSRPQVGLPRRHPHAAGELFVQGALQGPVPGNKSVDIPP